MGIKFSQLPIASSVASDDYIAVLDSSESILKRTPISHASQATTYGAASTTEYGHSKLIDNLTTSTLTAGEALSARQGNVIANDMGQIETSTTAAYAHSAGSYFILIGQFVKCIADIAVGGTITLGTNVEATSIGAVLGQLNSKLGSTNISSIGSTITGAIYNLADPAVSRYTVTTEECRYLYNNASITRVNRIVFMRFEGFQNITSTDSYIDLFQLPSWAIPTASAILDCVDVASNAPDLYGYRMFISSVGLVRLRIYTAIPSMTNANPLIVYFI